MVIGTFGEVVFEVSRERAASFSSYEHEAGARLGTAEIIGGEPLTEFLGPDSQTISMPLRLIAELGVDPQTEYDRLHEILTQGLASSLVIANRPVGGSGARWIIERLNASHSHFAGDGTSRIIDVEISFRKYVQVKI